MKVLTYDANGLMDIKLTAAQIERLWNGDGIELVQPNGNTILIRPR